MPYYKLNLKKIKLKENDLVLAQMNEVIENYKKTQNLSQAAVDSKIDPNHVNQW